MSAGDTKFDDKPGSLAKLRALLIKYPAIGKRIRLHRQVCFGFDIPYLGGISRDGKYVYIDRHLPDKSNGVPLAKYIEVHESVEAALYDVSGQHEELAELHKYEPCHHLATAAEQFAVVSDGYSWDDYEDGLRPDFLPLAHEDIKRVPPDLATFQYDGKLLARMEEVASKSQFKKDEVNYRNGGKVNRCEDCAMFLPRTLRCTWVMGTIHPDDLCDKFERKT